jgi:hypothetical protein
VDAWTFIWLMLALKIPIVGLFLIVRWAVRQGPEPAAEGDGGAGVDPRPDRPRHPHRPRPRRGGRGAILSRRGPHRGAPALAAPARVRTATARARLKSS